MISIHTLITLAEIKKRINEQILSDYKYSETEETYIKVHEGTANGLQVALNIIDTYIKDEIEK